MVLYDINAALRPVEGEPKEKDSILVLLTPEELARGTSIQGLKDILCHTPSPRDARTCRAEVRHGCVCGSIVTPRQTKNGAPIAFGYLLADRWVILCDDTGTGVSMVQRLRKEDDHTGPGPGGFFYDFLELLLARDLHHLQELEEQVNRMEDNILAGRLEDLNADMMALRKEVARWIRYYTQMEDMVCTLQENESGLFSEAELRQLHLIEKRIGRLQSEAQTLREYGLQVREQFQAEIDVRQNKIMKTLTIVTTVFLPLTLVTGWYGMNFAGMPELTWKYGYPVVIGASAVIVLLCLWIMKKKRFW